MPEQPPYPHRTYSTREIAAMVATLATDAETLMGQADEHRLAQDTAGSVAAVQLLIADEQRAELRALRCLHACAYPREFLAWCQCEGYIVTDGHAPDAATERREAAWQWSVQGCPRATPCPAPGCGAQMERIDQPAEPDCNIGAEFGLACPICGHHIPDHEADEDGPSRKLRVPSVCTPPTLADLRGATTGNPGQAFGASVAREHRRGRFLTRSVRPALSSPASTPCSTRSPETNGARP